ncbi:monooxygenase 2-like [Andrographis paniculata]|uniref:monooxygenase 2-like n=1 Tax=Andrographis paniculata TaxID=175694 RepID=UPI0021E9915B|nr:monooxygenase 2-like [Andrographis paniculata]
MILEFLAIQVQLWELSLAAVVMAEETQMFEQDIVVVGAGIAGLSTALGLHRLGIQSVVLESSDSLRMTGFALTMWRNAWRALDALGIGHILRNKSVQIQGFNFLPMNSNQPTSDQSDIKSPDQEIRCVKRRDLLDTLSKELPEGTIRYSSRIISIEQSGSHKLVHLADGSIFRTKVLIGCDGINSMVAKWLGLQSPVSAGRAAIRGFVDYFNGGHGFEPKFHGFFGGGVRYGFIPCDEKSIYWFCTFTPSLFEYDENDGDPVKMKQFVMKNILNVPKRASDIVERTKLDSISCAQLKLRSPWNILVGNLSRNGVCVAGDALHPMTPDIGQGGCSALEDSIVLARCLGQAALVRDETRLERGVQKYAEERRWRSFCLISAAYVVGMLQESNNKAVTWLRKMVVSRYTGAALLRISEFDFGKLSVS